MHAHESSVSMVIYDLGLSDAQRGEIDTWKHVALKTFDFSKYAGHVTDLKNNAWKPLVIQVRCNHFPNTETSFDRKSSFKEKC